MPLCPAGSARWPGLDIRNKVRTLNVCAHKGERAQLGSDAHTEVTTNIVHSSIICQLQQK